jgi:hypothetical protein
MIRYEGAQGGQGDFSGQSGYPGSTQRGQGPY